MLFVFLGMAYASKSTAALLAALVYGRHQRISTVYGGRAARRALTGVIFGGRSCASLLSLPLLRPTHFLELIGKDPTLTGRTEIWAYIIKDIWMKPLLGWGYHVFWLETNPAALEISEAVHWVVSTAHNGLLELLLDVGVFGAALFAFILIRTIEAGCSVSPHSRAGPSDIDNLLLYRDPAAGRE